MAKPPVSLSYFLSTRGARGAHLAMRKEWASLFRTMLASTIDCDGICEEKGASLGFLLDRRLGLQVTQTSA